MTTSRRDFIATSGKAAVVAAIANATVFPASRAWSLSTVKLSGPESATLLRFAWNLFPLEKVDESVYVAVVEGLDRRAQGDTALYEQIAAGIAKLDEARGKPWIALPEADQIAVMKDVERTPFFGTMRTAAVNTIFGNAAVWKLIGYEGSAVEHGGYVNRGFNDITWVPKN
jgi:hypothetical protein